MAFAIAASFFILYALTAQRGISWQDSGEFQFRVLTGDYTWNSGIARAHPGYIGLATLFVYICSFLGIGAIFATTLFSAAGSFIAIYFLFLNTEKLTRDAKKSSPSFPLAAAGAALALGFSHMFWWMSSMAEVYTWSLAMLMAEIYYLTTMLDEARPRTVRSLSAILLFLACGLHFSIHNFALLALPVYVICLIITQKRLRTLSGAIAHIAICALAFTIGAFLVLNLAVREYRGSETATVLSVIKSVLVGDWYADVVIGTGAIRPARILVNYALAALSVLAPCWLFVFRGMRTKIERHADARKALLAITAIHFIFWVRYFVPDQATFILPLLGLSAIWAGIGLSGIEKKKAALVIIVSATIQILLPVAATWAVEMSSGKEWSPAKRVREVPYRDEAAYWLLPWKHCEDSAMRFLRELDVIISEKGKDGKGVILYADPTVAAPILASLIANQSEPGWLLLTPWSPALPSPEEIMESGCRFLTVSPAAGYLPEEYLKAFTFRKCGIIFEAE